jgi:hypothetical protein
VTVSVRIWTEFASEEAKSGRSGYGVGTRPQDQPTLRFHERAHGEGWFTFLRNNPPPAFAGTSGMLPAQYNAAVAAWQAAIRNYNARAGEFALQAGDCVGTLPTNQQLEGTGYTAAICHQNQWQDMLHLILRYWTNPRRGRRVPPATTPSSYELAVFIQRRVTEARRWCTVGNLKGW